MPMQRRPEPPPADGWSRRRRLAAAVGITLGVGLYGLVLGAMAHHAGPSSLPAGMVGAPGSR
ncbi:MAG: hypothetical protein NVSMB55_09060 [Mycobacteriales bacterium]